MRKTSVVEEFDLTTIPKSTPAKSHPDSIIHDDDAVVKGQQKTEKASTKAAAETLKPVAELKPVGSISWPPIPWGSLPSLPSFLSFTKDIKLQMCVYAFVPSF